MKISFFSSFLGLLFPAACFNCSLRISSGVLCDSCKQSLKFLTDICPVCGAYDYHDPCRVCLQNSFQFDQARSVFRFDAVIQKLIHDLKYDEMKRVAGLFGEFAEIYLHRFQPFASVDIIAPVPLHKVKKRARGFNQAQLLTAEISRRMDWRHEPNLIRRSRFTETQTMLGRVERQENVRAAFSLHPKIDVKNKNILIVDDVFTTGSTVNSISALLKSKEAERVFVLTIARA